MPDDGAGLWVTLWVIGAVVCVALFVWTKKFSVIVGSHNRVRPLILLGMVPCGGLGGLLGLGAFAIFMAIALPAARRQAEFQAPSAGAYPTGLARPGRGRGARSLLPEGTADRIVAFAKDSFYHDQKFGDWQLEPDMYRLAQMDGDRFLDEIVLLSKSGAASGWLSASLARTCQIRVTANWWNLLASFSGETVSRLFTSLDMNRGIGLSESLMSRGSSRGHYPVEIPGW
jgi:hypothetical protein